MCSPGRGREGRPRRGEGIRATSWSMRKRISGAKGSTDHRHWELEGALEPPVNPRILGSGLVVRTPEPMSPGPYSGCLPSAGCLHAVSAWASMTSFLPDRCEGFVCQLDLVSELIVLTVCSALLISYTYLIPHLDPCRAQQFLLPTQCFISPGVNNSDFIRPSLMNTFLLSSCQHRGWVSTRLPCETVA